MKRLLVANLLFSPRSFGGATVVAEEIAFRLAASGEWDVTVLSASNYGLQGQPVVTRTQLRDGIDHYTVNFGGIRTPDALFETPEVTAEINAILDRVQPDAAHLHCIQGLGVGLIDALHERGVPTVLTTHDYWWLCEKIFMLDYLDRWCGQEVIDRKRCLRCAHTSHTLDRRWEKALDCLNKVDAITYPSRYARDQYERNGAPKDRGSVLPNGVTPPGPEFTAKREARSSGRVRFGYIGGPGPLKGWSAIERAFPKLDPAKAELVVVDAATHIGEGWWAKYKFGALEPFVTIVPGYTMETIDDFFAGIDVLLFLSTWKETFGLTTREAALRGVHVLATDCGAPVEHLIGGDTATILPGMSASRGLVRALRKLSEEGPPKPTDAGRAKITEEIRSYDRQTAEVETILQRVMRNS